MKIIEDKTHARLSPSASKRWLTCPGSVALEQALNLPDNTSVYASEGTVAHEVHELCLKKNKDAEEYIGYEFEADGRKFTVDRGMADAVQISLDYIRDRIQELKDEGYSVKMYTEVKAKLTHLDIEGLDGGTSDTVLVIKKGKHPVGIEVIDYKHGAGVPVEVFKNTQGLCYATGVVFTKGFHEEDLELGIRITISQPRAMHQDGPIRIWELSLEELIDWQEEELIPGALATLEPDAEIVPDDEGCRFCPAAGTCAALYQRTQETAMADFADNVFPDPVTMSSDQKKYILEHAKMINSFILAVEKQVKFEVDSGSKDYEDKFKLVQKTTHRKFNDLAFDEICSPLLDYLSEDDIYDIKQRSLTDIERRLKKKVGKEETERIMNEITDKPEGEKVIAPISDTRQEVDPSISTDFNHLIEKH